MSYSTTRYIAKFLAFTVPAAFIVVSFQNCAPNSMETVGTSTAKSSTTGRSGSSSTDTGSTDYGSSSETGSNSETGSSSNKVAFKFQDTSLGNGTIVTHFRQKVYGAGAGVRACTALMSNYNTHCIKSSDFVLLVSAWGDSSFDSVNNVYSLDQDVSVHGYPFQQYFSRYIMTDGTSQEVTFTPTYSSSTSSSGGLKWVYTNPQACIGPTPSPAPIGQSCSVAGQTATNDCGTATCQ